MRELVNTVLAVDPGRRKCGIAVVRKSANGSGFETLRRAVIAAADVAAGVSELIAEFDPDVIVIGDGTASAQIVRAIKDLGSVPVEIVDETFSTLHARSRYFLDNPPRGLRRLIPVSLQTPNLPYDDYVAVVLAEKFLTQ